MYARQQQLSKAHNEALYKPASHTPSMPSATLPNSALLSWLGKTDDSTDQPNKTDLPDALKARFERLMGMPLDDVRVHRNSAKPAELGALAYAKGNEIHLGPGQEKHLEHELGHVVQQKSGLVKPTTIINGKLINDNEHLENNADSNPYVFGESLVNSNSAPVIQCYIPRIMQDGPNCGIYALVMALMDLTGETKHEDDAQGVDQQQRGKELADKIQEKAKAEGHSSIGEFFSAESLKDAANSFLEGDASFGAKSFKSETRTFTNEAELKAIIDQAKNNNVHVLLAFDADNPSGSKPSISRTSSIPKKKMHYAHWGVIKHSKHSGLVSIREGGQTKKDDVGSTTSLAISVADLFKSNSALNTQMDWNAFIYNPETLTSDRPIISEAIDKRKIDKPSMFEPTGRIEKVDLRGKVVLVGKSEDVDNMP